MKRLIYISLSVFMSITMADCGPGKFFGPTITPTPTETLTETPSPTVTPSPTDTLVPTRTEIPSPTPKPVWQTAMETQDPQDQYFKVVDSQPVITLDGAWQTAKTIVLKQESIQIITTADTLHPNVLTAKDAEDNIYLFNPDRGSWFTFCPRLASALDRFPLADKSDIPIIIDYLRSQPSLLDPDAPAANVGPNMHRSDGYGRFDINGPYGSHTVAASIEIHDKGYQRDILIWEVKMKNGESGYLLGFIYDPMEYYFLSTAGDYRIDFDDTTILSFMTGCAQMDKHIVPYVVYLLQQPGFQKAVDAYTTTGIIPPELETIILPEQPF